MSDVAACSPAYSIPKSGSSGMLQYLQSWFPGWGGWYGDSDPVPEGSVEAQAAAAADKLLTDQGTWDMLGESPDWNPSGAVDLKCWFITRAPCQDAFYASKN